MIRLQLDHVIKLRKLIERGLSDKEAMKEFNKRKKRKEFEWTQENIDMLFALKDEGYSDQAIALRMGLTKGQVSGKWYRIGTPSEKPLPLMLLPHRRPIKSDIAR